MIEKFIDIVRHRYKQKELDPNEPRYQLEIKVEALIIALEDINRKLIDSQNLPNPPTPTSTIQNKSLKTQEIKPKYENKTHSLSKRTQI